MRESERPLGPRALAGIEALAARRLAGEPVARILGVKEFWGLPFAVTPAVLVPRPETETVVETALARLDAAGARERPLRIADLGTGSGAILLALLHELPQALRDRHRLQCRGDRDRAGECAAARRCRARGLRRLRFRCRARRRLRSRRHQPALHRDRRDRDARPRGPRFRSRRRARRRRRRPCRLSHDRSPMPDGCWRRARLWCMEVGAGQSDAVSALAGAAGLTAIAATPDLAGIPRVVSARYP